MDSSGTESRLRAHVEALAGTIGERHLLRPHALAAAADYIDAAWRAQGYVPERETFTVNGVNCATLISYTGATEVLREIEPMMTGC